MTDAWRYACPECGSRQVRQRTDSRGRHGDVVWSCDARGCYATFDHPVDLKQA